MSRETAMSLERVLKPAQSVARFSMRLVRTRPGMPHGCFCYTPVKRGYLVAICASAASSQRSTPLPMKCRIMPSEVRGYSIASVFKKR